MKGQRARATVRKRLVSDTSRANLAVWYELSPLIGPRLPHSEADDATVLPDTTPGRIKTKKKNKSRNSKMELSLNPINKKKEKASREKGDWGKLQSALFSRSMGAFLSEHVFRRHSLYSSSNCTEAVICSVIDCRRRRSLQRFWPRRPVPAASGAVLQAAASLGSFGGDWAVIKPSRNSCCWPIALLVSESSG